MKALKAIRPLRGAAVLAGTALIAGVAGMVGMVGIGAAGSSPGSGGAAAEEGEPLAPLGIAVTSGAAPGYVPDPVCATCHAEIALSYRQVGMARSFFRPRADNLIEDFSAPSFDHAPSRQRFQIVRTGETLTFRRWRLDPEGQPGLPFEQKIDWILGSGHHSRTYLYRTPDGALFQLPLEWYSQERRWGMAPGYDRSDHDGVLRRVRRECLFCHNGYPDVPAGSDANEAPHTFPAELPAGTGCQRCHGPGAEHVRRAMGGIDVREGIRAAIVNPAKLAPARRDDVCDQCHLQPIVALAGVRRSGRGDYSFRPGEPLPDYQVLVDAEEEGGAEADRFEIDHQSYRMRRSRCFTATRGAGAAAGSSQLSCLTCHDPHRRVPEAERAEHYRTACQTCHQGNACTRPRAVAREASPSASDASAHSSAAASALPAEVSVPAALEADRSDCVSCHMPKRRPRDVVHVVMTDHLIRRRPGGPELVAPLAESEPILTSVRVFDPARLLSAREAEIYRTLPVVRTGASPEALDHLAKLLAAPAAAEGSGSAEDPLRLELAAGLLRRRQYAAAEGILTEVSKRGPATARTLEWLGLARDGQGKAAPAEEALRAALALPGVESAEVAARLGQILARQGRHREAAELLREAVALRPNLVAAWFHLGAAQAALGERGEARDSLQRALALDPNLKAAEEAIAKLDSPLTPPP